MNLARLFLLFALTIFPQFANAQENAKLKEADALFKAQNWAEARVAYDAARDAETDWRAAPVKLAVEGAVASSLKLKQWDDALQRAGQYVEKTRGTLEEAVGERFLAGLYWLVPHYGTKSGANFRRGEYGQGVQVSSWKKDRKSAIQHYERARELLIELQNPKGYDWRASMDYKNKLVAEQIGVNFDLAGVLAQHNGGNYGRWGWWGWWWNAPDEEDSEAVEEADYEESRWGYGWNQDQTPPLGLPIGPNGKPQFGEVAKNYEAAIGDGAKIRFLLEEIQKIDASPTKDDAARALLRWAMICKSLYGPEAAAQWKSAVSSDFRGQALPKPDVPEIDPWELKENQTLAVVAGQLRLIELPDDQNPFAILAQIAVKYPQSRWVAEAKYTRALLFQTRQQFPTAIAQYRALIVELPEHPRAKDAKSQIAGIEKPGVALESGEIFLPGKAPVLGFSHRNTDNISFKATRVDLARFVEEKMRTPNSNGYWDYQQFNSQFTQDANWKKYAQGEGTSWQESVKRGPQNRVAKGETSAPLLTPGAYVVEADSLGNPLNSRVLVLVSDIAIVQKNLVGKGLIWLADARSGQPLKQQAVRIYEHWTEYKDNKNTAHWESGVSTTDENGVIEYKKRHSNAQVDAVVTGEKGRMAFSFFQSWNENSWNRQESGSRIYVVTDRPVYRPNSLVKFRVWLRRLEKGEFVKPKAGEKVSVSIYDAKNANVKNLALETDELGGVSGEFQLGDEPPLGIYRISVNGESYYGWDYNSGIAGNVFRVEEYKKPEFEVLVKPATNQARLGETVRARVSARYYFGEPVKSGTISYKVFRENYRQIYLGEGEYDWLYGAGYGRAFYPYPWFSWWNHPNYWPVATNTPAWNSGFDWRRRLETNTRKALRELVAQGTAQLGPDGTYDIEIETSGAPKNGDSRYIVEAEVRDASRRTITGAGSVLATRQQFSAFVETDAGWYSTKNEASVKIRTLTPDNMPVAAKGSVVIWRVERSAGAVKEREIARWDAQTDVEGRLNFQYPIAGEGQYRIEFLTRDSWKSEVQGNAVFWVNGPKFEGRIYRFNDLEVIADQRTYKIGETAHLLLHTARPNARVLWSDEVGQGTLRSYRFLEIPNHSLVVDVPITARQVPNFFVEATVVSGGRVYSEARELLVPPIEGLLNVRLKTDKPTYKTGETGQISVAVTDAHGQPVRGQIALTAYDQSVTYIQDEFGPSPRVFYYGQKRTHSTSVQSSLNQTFYAYGGFQGADSFYYVGGVPESWSGSWTPEASGLGLTTVALIGARDDDLYNRPFYNRTIGTYFSIGEEFGANGGLGYARRGASVGAFGVSGLEATLGRQRTQFGMGLLYDNDLSPTDQIRSDFGGPLIDPEIRSNFADTALWLPDLTLDKNGKASAKITFPESLTTWKLHGYALTDSTQVGDATATANTTKKLLVRLEAPRFFVERDEVVLSANVHNYLAKNKKVRAELLLPAALFGDLSTETGAPKTGAPDAEGNLHLVAEKIVEANGEARFDWPVKVLKSGLARITAKALTDEESDGMRLAFPVLVHGTPKTLAQSGSYRTDQDGKRDLKIDLPAQIDGAQTRLDITLSPSLAGVMVDALPYLAGYPYGCVEQTMSRFYPSVLVKSTLKKLGTDLETVGKSRAQMDKNDLQHRFPNQSPVFDSAELDKMVAAGLQRITNFQNPDGGWGWWSNDQSSAFQTAYVLQGLKAAKSAGVNVNSNVYSRGIQFLRTARQTQLAPLLKAQYRGDLQTQAYIAYILSLETSGQSDEEKQWLTDLFEARGQLTNYGRALLALALKNYNRPEDAQLVLRNLLQFAEKDDQNQTAWIRTPDENWWFWWNNDIETNAWALKALVAIEPKNELAPRIVKWLLNNRRNGYYWRSTRDTAQVISAMTDYLKASGEDAPDYNLVLSLDGKPLKEIKIDKTNFWTFDNRISLTGDQIPAGSHQLTISKKGAGALYYSTYLSFFTEEEDVKGAGNEIFVERQYFKLTPRTETVVLPNSNRSEKRDGWLRTPLNLGDQVKSGEQIEVVLGITAKNTYDYLAFEDMKPAGCEPVELQSGGRWAGGVVANVELRDEKVVFFVPWLEQGKHVLRYKMRAETPGKFHVLPTRGFAMYAPEVKGISDEMRLGIGD